MKKELQKPVINAILALILIILVRIVAMVILKPVDIVYSVIGIALSLAVIVILLRFMKEFNRQLAISAPGYPQARQAVKWFILLLVILTLYGAFSPFAADLPYGIYHIIFFILALIPVYSMWNILYKNSSLVLELIKNISLEDNLMCSCGWNNPISAKFCNRCGLPLQEKV
ncbi:MAG: zinc ribbon domain-containing protein [Candidatus Methanoperedens sp.]